VAACGRVDHWRPCKVTCMVGQKQAYILLHQVTKIFRECWQWADEQTTKFWWRSASGIRILIRIETLVRHALAEVRVVPVLLVLQFYCDYLLRPFAFLRQVVAA